MSRVHLRRALLLFAIVLGLAAVAASVSRPRNADSPGTAQETLTQSEQPPTAAPGAPAAVELTLSAANPEAQRIRAGQAATLFVEVEEPGQVAIPDLGMGAAAEPLTPARFDVLTRETGRHPIEFEPAGADDAQVRVGTLVVVEGR
jgi:hypothetical protein